MSEIKKQYYPDDKYGSGERKYLAELRFWLKGQSQDAWLLSVRAMNWDSMEDITDLFIDNPDTDIATIAELFWANEPSYWIKQSQQTFSDGGLKKIIKNVNNGFYQDTSYSIDRWDLVNPVQAYATEKKSLGSNVPPFEIPKRLLGPFTGNNPVFSRNLDQATIDDLKEIYWELGIQHDPYWFEGKVKKSNYPHHLSSSPYFKLPRVPHDPISEFSHLDELEYIEKIYGKSEDYNRARNPAPAHKKRLSFDQKMCLGLAIFGVVSISFALIMHRINTGTW